MADTTYEHAGNADQLREIQFDPSPRCESCHFVDGYVLAGHKLNLEPVDLPDPHNRRALFCDSCISIAQDTGDTDYSRAAATLRPLPEVTRVANAELLATFEWAEQDTGEPI